MTKRIERPQFQFDDLEIDRLVEARVAAKGIPTLVPPKAEETMAPAEKVNGDPARLKEVKGPQASKNRTKRRNMFLSIEVPDYVWIALKTRAAQEMGSLRHFTLKAYRAQGIEIRDEDMMEDGRRLRGARARRDLGD